MLWWWSWPLSRRIICKTEIRCTDNKYLRATVPSWLSIVSSLQLEPRSTPDHSPVARTKLSSQAMPFQPAFQQPGPSGRWVAVPLQYFQQYQQITPVATTQWQPVPNVGSAEHAAGRCTPCAFFQSTGCANGQNCSFCHLCS